MPPLSHQCKVDCGTRRMREASASENISRSSTLAVITGSLSLGTDIAPQRARAPLSDGGSIARTRTHLEWEEPKTVGASWMRYESWVERQVREAIERGEFDNLPGQGKPIKGLNGRDDENWWVKSYLEREQLPLPLPASLALRKEVKELQATLADVPDEESVREIVKDLNHRIASSHRIRVDGPPIVIGLVNVERAVADWRRRKS